MKKRVSAQTAQKKRARKMPNATRSVRKKTKRPLSPVSRKRTRKTSERKNGVHEKLKRTSPFLILTFKTLFTLLLVSVLTLGGVDVWAVGLLNETPLISNIRQIFAPEKAEKEEEAQEEIPPEEEVTLETVTYTPRKAAKPETPSPVSPQTDTEVASNTQSTRATPVKTRSDPGTLSISALTRMEEMEEIADTMSDEGNRDIDVGQHIPAVPTVRHPRTEIRFVQLQPIILPPPLSIPNDALVRAVTELLVFLQSDAARYKADSSVKNVSQNTYATNTITVNLGDNALNPVVTISSDANSMSDQLIASRAEMNMIQGVVEDALNEDAEEDPECDGDQDGELKGEDPPVEEGENDPPVHTMCDPDSAVCEKDCPEVEEEESESGSDQDGGTGSDANSEGESGGGVVEEVTEEPKSVSEEAASAINIDADAASQGVQEILGGAMSTIQNSIAP